MTPTELLNLSEKINDVYSYLSTHELNCEKVTVRNILREALKKKEFSIDLEKQIEAYKEVCEKYIPTNKLDEANSEVILICKGMAESMGRDLLKHEK